VVEKKKGGVKGRKSARKSAERVAEDMLKEQVADTIPMRGRGKKTIAKKVAEETGEPVEPVEPVAPAKSKPKRTVSPKTRERLAAQLAKGRATRAANFARKKKEREEMMSKVKMKVAEPAAVKEIHHYHTPAPPAEKPAEKPPTPAPKPKAVAKRPSAAVFI